MTCDFQLFRRLLRLAALDEVGLPTSQPVGRLVIDALGFRHLPRCFESHALFVSRAWSASLFGVADLDQTGPVIAVTIAYRLTFNQANFQQVIAEKFSQASDFGADIYVDEAFDLIGSRIFPQQQGGFLRKLTRLIFCDCIKETTLLGAQTDFTLLPPIGSIASEEPGGATTLDSNRPVVPAKLLFWCFWEDRTFHATAVT